LGTVYKAYDVPTNRFVALKVLAAGLAGAHRTRFEAESAAEAQIRHPHVMPVYDRGTFGDDRTYFVMELVYEPITLSEVVELIQRGTIDRDLPRLRQWADPAKLIAEVLIPVAEGVDAANRQFGIVHRDLKPDNVLIDARTRRPYLIDFGICHHLGTPVEAGKLVGRPGSSPPSRRPTASTSGRTSGGSGPSSPTSSAASRPSRARRRSPARSGAGRSPP
jgi:serine/threonine protein kinase